MPSGYEQELKSRTYAVCPAFSRIETISSVKQTSVPVRTMRPRSVLPRIQQTNWWWKAVSWQLRLKDRLLIWSSKAPFYTWFLQRLYTSPLCLSTDEMVSSFSTDKHKKQTRNQLKSASNKQTNWKMLEDVGRTMNEPLNVLVSRLGMLMSRFSMRVFMSSSVMVVSGRFTVSTTVSTVSIFYPSMSTVRVSGIGRVSSFMSTSLGCRPSSYQRSTI